MRIGKIIWRAGLVTAGVAAFNLISGLKAPVQRSRVILREYDWNGWALRYAVQGAGEAVLLIHSLNRGASSDEFEALIPELAQHYQVYALNLPSFGYSEERQTAHSAELLSQAIQDFILEQIKAPVHLVLNHHSSVLLCGIKSENLISITLNSPTASALKDPIQAKLLKLPIYGEALWRQSGGTIGRFAQADRLEGAFDLDLLEVLKQNHVPLLLQVGQLESSAPAVYAKILREKLEESGGKSVVLHSYSRSKMFPWLEEKAQYLETLRTFLEATR
jgi:pimeloyl-ACP methyl ester carboxylesterase